MIAANTKCTIKAAPAVLSHLIGKEAIAQEKEGARLLNRIVTAIVG